MHHSTVPRQTHSDHARNGLRSNNLETLMFYGKRESKVIPHSYALVIKR